MVALFPGLPRFCSSVCVQYKTQKRKNTKNREGLGTRLQIWLHTVSNMTLDVWLITVRGQLVCEHLRGEKFLHVSLQFLRKKEVKMVGYI